MSPFAFHRAYFLRAFQKAFLISWDHRAQSHAMVKVFYLSASTPEKKMYSDKKEVVFVHFL